MILGFTGSRYGMSPQQTRVMQMYIRHFLAGNNNEFHQGGCVGCDEQAAEYAHMQGYKIITHPPIIKTLASNKILGTYLPAKPYLERNRDIVDVSDSLIAVPRNNQYEPRSGTWSTIKYARRHQKPIIVLGTNGNVLDDLAILDGRGL